MNNNFKSWHGWLLFGVSMTVVFCLGLAVSALSERRAEVVSIFNNRKNPMKGIVPQNEKFQSDFPREYQTWTETANTDFQSEFNGNVMVDVLEQRPEMVILWAGYAFSKDYSTPRGHMHAIEDIRATLRTGSPENENDGPQPSTCWTCKSPDVPRMAKYIEYKNKTQEKCNYCTIYQCISGFYKKNVELHLLLILAIDSVIYSFYVTILLCKKAPVFD